MRTNPICAIVVGRTDSGKSTYIRKAVRNKSRVLCVTPHEGEFQDFTELDFSRGGFAFEGSRRALAYGSIVDDINRKPDFYRNGALIFDDSRFYINSKVEKSLEQILVSRKQRGLDIFISAHGLTVIPPIFFMYVSHFVLFKTQDNLVKRKKDLIWYDEISEMQKEVNENPNPHFYKIFKTINGI